MPRKCESIFPTLQVSQTELTILSDNSLNRRGFSDVVSHSVDWQGSVYIPPASSGVSYSASAIPSASAWNSYSNSHWQSWSSSALSYASKSSMPATLSSVGGGPAPSRGPNNNTGGQNSQSINGPAAASSSAAPSPASPGAASTFSNFGCALTMMLAALTGVVAFVL